MTNVHTYPFFALFTNNGYAHGFRPAIAFSEEINEITTEDLPRQNKPVIPVISYDLKNSLEKLSSRNEVKWPIPDLCLIAPEEFKFTTEKEVQQLLETFTAQVSHVNIQARVSKAEYIQRVNKLKQHIQQGNIYEVNYCVEFFANNAQVDPYALFRQYNALSKSPFSCFIKYNNLFILCGSPERFLNRDGNKLISQPIKGTRKRSNNDAEMIRELENDQKERAENIMIVDLVRNDLSRIAKKGSITVDELCKVYTFETVHQSISTISCHLKDNTGFDTILQATFPMGSMTGAPKISAMKLIDETENSRRQIYSGSTGYLLPNGDFDLNVIIRTMIYDQKNKYLSFMVGSAITAASDPEKEYEECMVKASGMMRALNTKFA
ncbi:MAG TPA: anthranilate synthase component I family protein [Flavobacteriales bacterium]|nr:anthranilate synthase component I family protein [Flavobacteriales bacterium]